MVEVGVGVVLSDPRGAASRSSSPSECESQRPPGMSRDCMTPLKGVKVQHHDPHASRVSGEGSTGALVRSTLPHILSDNGMGWMDTGRPGFFHQRLTENRSPDHQ
jgi:hypothetical protein